MLREATTCTYYQEDERGILSFTRVLGAEQFQHLCFRAMNEGSSGTGDRRREVLTTSLHRNISVQGVDYLGMVHLCWSLKHTSDSKCLSSKHTIVGPSRSDVVWERSLVKQPYTMVDAYCSMKLVWARCIDSMSGDWFVCTRITTPVGYNICIKLIGRAIT